MSPRVSWLFFASRDNAPRRPVALWDFAAQDANRQSHLILGIDFVIHDFSGLMIRVTIHRVLRLFSSSFCPSRTLGQ